MINLILFGPPGSGKGTQAEYIVREENLIHISTGDLFRKNITQKTDLGNLANEYISLGKLVPDQITIDLLAQELDQYTSPNGFIFDGFPRTVLQAQAFDSLLGQKKMTLSMVISLEVSVLELVNRLLNRGMDSGRADDQNENIIRNRIQVYDDQTAVLKDYYANTLNKRFHSIDGERSIEKISNDIKGIITNSI